MYDFIKTAGTVVIFVVAGFYAFMYFRAGSVEFPYHLLPDAVKLDRMIAAELMQCALQNPDTDSLARWGIGMAPTETAAFLAQATLRSEIIQARDDACESVYEEQKSDRGIIDGQRR